MYSWWNVQDFALILNPNKGLLNPNSSRNITQSIAFIPAVRKLELQIGQWVLYLLHLCPFVLFGTSSTSINEVQGSIIWRMTGFGIFGASEGPITYYLFCKTKNTGFSGIFYFRLSDDLYV
jgi:hypothetical protein